jgi:hypothetical protein
MVAAGFNLRCFVVKNIANWIRTEEQGFGSEEEKNFKI